MFIHGTPYFWPRKLLTLFELVQKDLCMTSLYAKAAALSRLPSRSPHASKAARCGRVSCCHRYASWRRAGGQCEYCRQRIRPIARCRSGGNAWTGGNGGAGTAVGGGECGLYAAPGAGGNVRSGQRQSGCRPVAGVGAGRGGGFPQQNGYDISGDLPVLTGLGRESLGRQGVSLGSLRYSPARLTRWKRRCAAICSRARRCGWKILLAAAIDAAAPPAFAAAAAGDG